MNDSYSKLTANWSDELKEAAAKNRYSYIHEKASLFILLGKEKYRELDFFNEPDESLTSEEIEVIRQGCQQILQGKGLTAEQPFENLDVWGFHALMQLFHYRPVSRNSQYSKVNETYGVLDQIVFQHLVEDSQVEYFNFCAYNQR